MHNPISFSKCVLSSYYLPWAGYEVNEANGFLPSWGLGSGGLSLPQASDWAALSTGTETVLCFSWEASQDFEQGFLVQSTQSRFFFFLVRNVENTLCNCNIVLNAEGFKV